MDERTTRRRRTVRDGARRAGASTGEPSARLAAKKFAEIGQPLLNAYPGQVALLDAAGDLHAVNEIWIAFGRANGVPAAHDWVGSNYLAVCDRAAAGGDLEAAAAAAGIRSVLAGVSDFFCMDYPCHAPHCERWFCLRVTPFSLDGERAAVVMHLDITDRHRADLALKASEAQNIARAERLERILNVSMDVICTLDEQGRILSVNTAGERLWRREAQSLQGSSVLDLCFDEQEREASRQRLSEIVQGMAIRAYDMRWRREDGQVIDLSWSAQWCPSARVVVCVVRDMTAANAARAENERLAARVRRTLENMPDAFVLLDTSWRFSYINREAERILQRSRRELRGNGAWDVFPEAIGTQLHEEYARAMREGRKTSFETFYAPLDIWLSVHAFPSPEGLAVYFVDVTERRRAVEALQASEQRLQMITRVTADATWEWTLADHTVWWSEGLQSLFGLRFDGEPRGMQPWEQCIHPEDRERVTQRWRQHLAGAVTHCSDEYRFLKADGRYAVVHDRRFIERTAEGRALRVVGAMTDVTELRRVQAEAHAAVQTRAFLASAQQELSNEDFDFDSLMNLLLARAKALTRASGAVIELFSDPGHLCARYCDEGREQMLGRDIDVARSFSGEVLRAGRPLLCADVANHAGVDQAAAAQAGARSLVAVPLGLASAPIGVLKLISAQRDAFATHDLTHLQVLAESVRVVLQRQDAIARLRESETQYRMLFERSPHPMWVYDQDSRQLLAVNEAAEAIYGWSDAEFRAMRVARGDTPQDLEAQVDGAAPADGALRRHRRRDGSVLDVELSAQPLPFQHRSARLVMVTDVTERSRAQREVERFHRIQQLLSACNLAQTRAESEDELLLDICRLALEAGGFTAAWVGDGAADGAPPLKVRARAGRAVDALIDRSMAPETGAFAQRAFAHCEVIASGRIRIADDDADHWGLALPLMRRANQSMGVLCLYADDASAFESGALPALRDLAGDLSFGIHHLHAQRDRRRLEAAIISVAAGVSGSSGSEFLDRLCQSMVEALDAHAGFIARLVNAPGPPRMRVIAGIADGRSAQGLEYECRGTPCEELLAQDELVISQDLSRRYPALQPQVQDAQAYVGRRLLDSKGQPLGLLFVMYRRPIQRLDFKRSTLRIFASRVASELERREDESRLRDQASLLDQAKDGIVLRSLDGHVQFWSRGAERLFGWSPGEALGEELSPLLHEDPAAIEDAVQQVLRDGEWSGVMHIRRKDGQLITTEGHWTLVRDADARPRAILAINTDISHRLAVEAQLQQSQRLEAVGQLTGGVAHDFNNLLTVILGNAELLAEAHQDDPYLGPLAGMIRTAAQRGSELTYRLLAFARRQNLEPRSIDVNALVEGLRSMLERTLGEDIRFELDLADDLWLALADAAQLESALLNLCINARDAMPQGGRLVVATRNQTVGAGEALEGHELTAGDYVAVSVSDSGVGIPQDQLKRVFEPFFTTKAVGKGSGLGLSMVYGFVKQSRGHLAIQSTVGAGTRLTVWLPRAAAGPSAAAPEPDAADADALCGSGCILLAEDDPLVRRYAADQLRELGYDVIEVEDGRAALEVLRKGTPVDLLFTDVVMPGGLRGPELVEQARRLRPQLRVLYTSGYTETALDDLPPERAAQLLRKPYARIDLARKVRAALSEESAHG